GVVLAGRGVWRPVPGPGFRAPAAAPRVEAPAAGPAARAPPGVDLDLPHAGEENPRVARVDRDVGAAGALVDEQRARPRCAAVDGAIDAAILLRPVSVAERAREHDVGISRIDHDPPDPTRVVEARVLPGPPGVGRLVDTVADRDVAADERLASAGPDDVGIGRRDGERADRGDRLVVEDRLPVRAVVGGLEDAARCRARVVD